MTAEGWAIIIGAMFLGLTQVLNIWITYLKGRDAALAARDAAVTAHAALSAAADAASVSHAQLAQGELALRQSQDNAAKLDVVHEAVNSQQRSTT